MNNDIQADEDYIILIATTLSGLQDRVNWRMDCYVPTGGVTCIASDLFCQAMVLR